jgi:hypothetical protein
VSARLPDRVRRFARLPQAERIVTLRALVLLAAMPLLVRVRGLPAMLRVRTVARGTVAPARTRQLVAAVAASLPWAPSCLSESLTAARLIARDGGAAVLVLGVARADRAFAAHAWLEGDGLAAAPGRDGQWREVSRWVVGARRS